MRLRCRRYFLALIVLVLAGCGASDGENGAVPSGTPSATTTPTAGATPAPTETASMGELVAWAAGSQLLHSENGGIEWTQVGNATGRRLTFVDRDTGWVIGGNFILHTTDGGGHWTDQTANIVGVVPVIVDVAAIDGTRTVAVGGENPNIEQTGLRDGPPVVIVTSDGGATWRRATVEGVEPPTFDEVRLTSACLTAAGAGLAAGTDLKNFEQTVVLLTHDAGNSWENITARLPFLPNARAGCTVGEQLWFLGSQSSVFRSSDGGLTWQDRGMDLRPNLILHDLTFVDASIGWIVAEDPFGPPSMPSGLGHRIVLLDTRDAGEHWNERFVASGLGELTLGIDFFDRLRGIIVAQDEHPFALPRSSFGLSFVTADGGNTWTETIHPEPINALWDVELFP